MSDAPSSAEQPEFPGGYPIVFDDWCKYVPVAERFKVFHLESKTWHVASATQRILTAEEQTQVRTVAAILPQQAHRNWEGPWISTTDQETLDIAAEIERGRRGLD